MIRRIQFFTVTGLGILSFLLGTDFENHINTIGLLLILFGGIPHGATDHLLFRKSSVTFHGESGMWSFILIYLLLGISFLLIWLLSPFKAIVLFILISIYHFGQEHFEDITIGSLLKKCSFLGWGSFVLLTPLLWHADTTGQYIFEISGVRLAFVSEITRFLFLSFLLLFQISILLFLFKRGAINKHRLFTEFIQLILLVTLFITTPLLTGFAVYFVFWHSMKSMRDQLNFFKRNNEAYSLMKYVRDLFPLSFMAICFVIFSGYLLQQYSNHSFTSYVFVLLALITLPHILVFDRFYTGSSAELE